MALLNGAVLSIAPPDIVVGVPLTSWLREQSITHLIATPSVLASTPPDNLPEITDVIVGGEICTKHIVNWLRVLQMLLTSCSI